MIKTTKDGRTIRTGSDYTALKIRVLLMQGNRCADCARPVFRLEDCELHHKKGRGMAGSKRNDVVGETEVLCSGPCGCHAKRTPL